MRVDQSIQRTQLYIWILAVIAVTAFCGYC